MSLVNRIELANLNNMAGDRGGWDPMIRYAVIDTMGKTTMVNITNGGGKTTLCIGLIGMLARNARLLHDFHQRMCPVNIPERPSVFSHLRVEFLVPDANYAIGTGNLLSAVEERVPGHKYVFGIYGNSGDQGRMAYYTYPGKLEDAAILEGSNTLRSNKAFTESLRAVRGVKLDPPAQEWIGEVSEHIERSSIQDMARIQAMPSEDKIIEFFQVRKKKDYGSYDAGFFYEVLAPMLLSGLMEGEVDASEEHSFQDTVLTSLKHVFRARSQVAKKAKELRHLSEAIEHLGGAAESGKRAMEIDRTLQAEIAAASAQIARIQSMAAGDPIPGVPRPITGDDIQAHLAKHIVISDMESQPRIRDAGVAWLIGKPVSAINQMAARNGFEGRQLSQVLDYSCDLAPQPVRIGGHKARHFSLEDAQKLVDASESVDHGLTKASAREELHDAFWHIANKVDANPFRATRIAFEDEVARDQVDLKGVKEKLDDTRTRISNLEGEQQTITADQDQYRQLAGSGLFSQRELEAPQETLVHVERHERETQSSHENFVRAKGQAEMYMPAWKEFASDYGADADPAAILNDLKAERERLRAERKSKSQERGEGATAQKKATESSRKENTALNAASNELRQLKPMLEALTQFEEQHPGKSPGTFESQVRERISAEEGHIREAQTRVVSLKQAQADIAAFDALKCGISAQERLTLAKDEHLRLAAEVVSVCAEVTGLERHLTALSNEKIAPAQEYDRALTRLAAGFEFVHVHEVLAQLPSAAKKAAFKQFSALLFAPCFVDGMAAAAAAAELDKAKIRIPVVHSQGLSNYLKSATDASAVFVGSMTREAECLLDPALIPKEKQRLEGELTEARKHLAHLTAERDSWALDAPAQLLAARCVKAAALEPDVNLPIAQQVVRDGTDTVAELKKLIEDGALRTIRLAAEATATNARGKARKAELETDRAKAAVSAAEGEVARLEALVARLDEEIGRLGERIELILPSHLESILLGATGMLKLGLPRDLASLDAMAAESSDKLQAARARSQFKLALSAAQRHVDRTRRGGRSVDKELAEAQGALAGLTNDAQRLEASISRATAHSFAMQQPERLLDAVVIKLQKQYVACQGVLAGLVSLNAGVIDAAEPSFVVDLKRLLREQEITREVGVTAEGYIEQLRADLDEFDAESVGKALDHQRREKDRALDGFVSEARKASTSTALRDVEKMVLQDATGIAGVNDVLGLHETLVTKLATERAAHDEIARWESDQFAAASDRLKSFIDSASSGLDLLKRIAKSDDSSNMRFHIEASVCDSAAVNSMLKTLFADFADDWEIREASANKRGETDESVRKQDEMLKDMIQKACFSKIFVNPRIRFESTLLRKEGKHTFDLQLFSGGQKTALILAWMVRLNDFLIRRDMQKKGSSTLRKQARRYQSNFMLIDGLFSNLSHMPLIHESLRDIAAGRNDGRFQLIGFMHNPAYVNDPSIFPTLVLGRHNVTDPTKPGWLVVEQSASAGSVEMTHLFVAPKVLPKPTKGAAAALAK